MTELNRSEQYMYFQNKAYHYNRLKNIKSTIDDSTGPLKPLDPTRFFNKFRKSEQRRRQQQNEQMVTRLMGIVKSPRTELEISGGYSKFNELRRSWTVIKKDRIEQKREIELSNWEFGRRLTQVKPIVGDLRKWNEHYSRYQQEAKNASRFHSNHMPKSRLQIYGPYVPKHLHSLLDEEDVEEIKSNKKISLDNTKIFALPQILKSPRDMDWSRFKRVTFSKSDINQNTQSKDEALLSQEPAASSRQSPSNLSPSS